MVIAVGFGVLSAVEYGTPVYLKVDNLLAIGLNAAQIMVLARTRFMPALQPATNPVFGGAPDRGAVGTIAHPLFTEHLLAFELTSILLLAAIVGAVAVGKRKAS